MNKLIYHIASKTDWEVCTDLACYKPSKFDSCGFIHCSTKEQIENIANTIYQGREDVLMLIIESSLVKSEIKYEDVVAKYPHIYGFLNKDAIIRVVRIYSEHDCCFRLKDYE